MMPDKRKSKPQTNEASAVGMEVAFTEAGIRAIGAGKYWAGQMLDLEDDELFEWQ
jgi:hypothetical protein